MDKKEDNRCPHCGHILNPDPRTTYTFSAWATPALVTVISLMLFGFDYIAEGQIKGNFISRFQWSGWAVLGLWIFFVSVQSLRSNPQYGWLIVPFTGILFSLFFIILDVSNPPNKGFLNLDWAHYAILPIFTFIVVIPIISRLARKEPQHTEILEFLIEREEMEIEKNAEN